MWSSLLPKITFFKGFLTDKLQAGLHGKTFLASRLCGSAKINTSLFVARFGSLGT